MEAGDGPFGNAVGAVDGGGVGGFNEVLRDDVDGALVGGEEVGEGVFGGGKAAGETDGEDGGVVIYHLRVGEGGEIGGCS